VKSKPEASSTIVQVIGVVPGGKVACEIDPAVPAAVVDTFAVTAAAGP
jgi:hypothetical protein